jgi:hypothetical protein
MRRMIHRSEPKVLSLSGRVGAPALKVAYRQILRASETGQWVLNFAATMHIDFRDLREFAEKLRRMDSRPRIIVLSGLNPYCEKIVRFALGAGDWDLVLEEQVEWGSMETAPPAPWGNGAEVGHRTGRGPRLRAWEEAAVLLPPCVN